MLRVLQQVSGFFFYLLGLSFFAGYLLVRNGMWPNQAAVWMQIADLPLALSAIVYGGSSLYLSLQQNGSSRSLAWMIALPLGVVFAAIVAMNFWF